MILTSSARYLQLLCVFLEPASVVNRIANQLPSSVTSDPCSIIDELPNLKDAFLRIIIPSEIKLEIKDKLDYINISERMIYPGLDGVCNDRTQVCAIGPRFYMELKIYPKKEEEST